jgi:aminoglycoside phosphotransferase (APT) family kinase protein
MSAPRSTVHYWKCDRPAAMHGVARSGSEGRDILPELTRLLSGHFPGPFTLKPAGGKGNHLTYLLDSPTGRVFVRVEDGPEQDGHLAMESRVMGEVAKSGVPVPRVLFTDASRKEVPFAVQVIEYFDGSDLNVPHREGNLPLAKIAIEIGRNVARWQSVPVAGFGPFNSEATDRQGLLTGYHASYARYFHLHLERHLDVLVDATFLTRQEAAGILGAIQDHANLLDLPQGCLVHKDLALWNIMGSATGIRAFIDWDDAIAGDPTDDLSLLACFHPAEVVQAAMDGYASIKPLCADFSRRFWLHLLRNMLVKAVIRCQAGYFRSNAEGAFLLAAGQDGAAFRQFTKDRLQTAWRGLTENHPLSSLDP